MWGRTIKINYFNPRCTKLLGSFGHRMMEELHKNMWKWLACKRQGRWGLTTTHVYYVCWWFVLAPMSKRGWDEAWIKSMVLAMAFLSIVGFLTKYTRKGCALVIALVMFSNNFRQPLTIFLLPHELSPSPLMAPNLHLQFFLWIATQNFPINKR